MSRSASLAINLILVNLRINKLKPENEFQIVELAQQVGHHCIGFAFIFASPNTPLCFGIRDPNTWPVCSSVFQPVSLVLTVRRVRPSGHIGPQVENEFIGSPCGQLDQIMIYFAKAGMGTHFNPKTKAITYVPLGDTPEAQQLRIVGLDTGTTRHGLESSTYSIRSRVRLCERDSVRACVPACVFVCGRVWEWSWAWLVAVVSDSKISKQSLPLGVVV